MIPGDLGAELTRAIAAMVAAGELPSEAERVNPSGTWRAPPGSAAGGPAPSGSYATSLPFDLAALAGGDAREMAARLAGELTGLWWVDAAAATGPGYLTVTVTKAALARLAARIVAAGPDCARSDGLRGVSRVVPPLPDLTPAGPAAPPGWRQAWRDQAAALAGRLAEAAGATVTYAAAGEAATPGRLAEEASHDEEREIRGQRPEFPTVTGAVAYVGADAVRYGLARIPAGRSDGLERAIPVHNDLTNPFYAVSFAHADAASALRWATDLGLDRPAPDHRLARRLDQPAELALLARLSWLAERVAGAARRYAPDELPRYLEEVAASWQDVREDAPALGFGGRAAPADTDGVSARLWLADATRVTLAAGLGLIGVAARDRI